MREPSVKKKDKLLNHFYNGRFETPEIVGFSFQSVHDEFNGELDDIPAYLLYDGYIETDERFYRITSKGISFIQDGGYKQKFWNSIYNKVKFISLIAGIISVFIGIYITISNIKQLNNYKELKERIMVIEDLIDSLNSSK